MFILVPEWSETRGFPIPEDVTRPSFAKQLVRDTKGLEGPASGKCITADDMFRILRDGGLSRRDFRGFAQEIRELK